MSAGFPVQPNWEGLVITECKQSNLLPYDSAEVLQFKFWIGGRRPSKICIGIDPGQVHMGLAILGLGVNSRRGIAFEIVFPSGQTLTERVMHTKGLLDYLLALTLPQEKREIVACIEQAAFGAPYGQAALAESRTAAVVALLDKGIVPLVKPPATIRKAVFGNGRQRAEEFNLWKDLAPNAASALACAFFCSGETDE